jgi:predicted DNA-binding transcriptional regulator AlpA
MNEEPLTHPDFPHAQGWVVSRRSDGSGVEWYYGARRSAKFFIGRGEKPALAMYRAVSGDADFRRDLDPPLPLIDREDEALKARVRGLRPDPLSYPPRGMSRPEAARYIGVGTSKFDQMVADKRMPKPKRVDGRMIWDRVALDIAFTELPDKAEDNYFDRLFGR